MRKPICGSCYSYGHTKRACPAIKEQLAAALSKPANERSWYENDIITKSEESKVRSCAYCAQTGHNINGCSQRKQDMVVATTNFIEFRKNILLKFKEAGIGVGAVVSMEIVDWMKSTTETQFFLVRGVEQDNLTPWGHSWRNFNYDRPKLMRCINVSPMQKLDGNRQIVYIPECMIEALWPEQAKKYGLNQKNRYSSGSIPDVSIPVFDGSLGFDEAQFVSFEVCNAKVQQIFDSKSQNGPGKRSRHEVSKYLVICEDEPW